MFLKFELKKLINKRIVIVLFFLSVIINGINSMNIVNSHNRGQTAQYKTAVADIYSKIEGELTNADVQYIAGEYQRLDKIISSGGYSMEYDANTYTGYVFTDSSLFRSIYQRMEYLLEYSANMQPIIDRAEENITFYHNRNNAYLAQYNQKIADLYSNRQITSFYGNEGWNPYLRYQFSNLLILMLIIFIIASVFSGEREQHMSVLLVTSKKGKGYTFFNKTIACGIISIIITIIFWLQDFLIFYNGFHMSGFFHAVYSLEVWQYSPLNISIIQFLGVIFFMKLIGIITITSLVMLSSAIVRSNLFASFLSILFIIIGIIFHFLEMPFDFIGLLAAQIELQKLKITKVFNIPVQAYFLNIIYCVIAVLAVIGICFALENKWRLFYRKERI